MLLNRYVTSLNSLCSRSSAGAVRTAHSVVNPFQIANQLKGVHVKVKCGSTACDVPQVSDGVVTDTWRNTINTTQAKGPSCFTRFQADSISSYSRHDDNTPHNSKCGFGLKITGSRLAP